MSINTEAEAILAAGVAISEKSKITEVPFIIVPEGYSVRDLENMLESPTRKRANVITTDSAGFCAYLNLQKSSASMIYADIDYEKWEFSMVGILNDHGQGTLSAGWRDHICTLAMSQSIEWKRWNSRHKISMGQGEFAAWLEENLGDVLSAEGMPSGGDILQMAIGFERTSEKRLKSKINLQSGGVRFEYVDDEDKDTRTSMQVFDRFAIAIPVFEGSTSAYRIDARLKYRENNGKLSFWFELIRPDRTFRQAVEDQISFIAKETSLLIINGNPGV